MLTCLRQISLLVQHIHFPPTSLTAKQGQGQHLLKSTVYPVLTLWTLGQEIPKMENLCYMQPLVTQYVTLVHQRVLEVNISISKCQFRIDQDHYLLCLSIWKYVKCP